MLALLIPLSNSEKDKARFPTKIAEYLASARPVVSSNIGEFANYATNNKNAVLCEPDDIAGFANGIITANELLSIEIMFTSAQNQYTNSFYNYLRAKSNLQLVMGIEDLQILEKILNK